MSITAPRFQVKRRKLVTIPFYDTISASTEKTLVSRRLPANLEVLRVRMRFPRNAGGQLYYKWFHSTTDNAPSEEPTEDFKLFADQSKHDLITGEDSNLLFHIMKKIKHDPVYIKLYVKNDYSDTMPVDASAEVLI